MKIPFRHELIRVSRLYYSEIHFLRMFATQENLRDMVVWNPWSENCEKMADMDDDGYKHMLCVEAAQTSQRSTVQPSTTWTATHLLTLTSAKSLLSSQL